MGELLQVLRDRSHGHVQRLINEIREEGRAHHAGPTRAAKWFFGPSAGEASDGA
jgi:hypothetical protein